MGSANIALRRTRILGALAGCVFILLGLVAAKSRLDEYVTQDPRFCQSCHEVRPEMAMWTLESHANVACQRCHTIREEELAAMLAGTVLPREGTPHLVLDRRQIRCEGCHHARTTSHTLPKAVRIHRVHEREKVTCLDCHGPRIHRVVQTETVCKRCHEEGTE